MRMYSCEFGNLVIKKYIIQIYLYNLTYWKIGIFFKRNSLTLYNHVTS